jgi:hypothetical protein
MLCHKTNQLNLMYNPNSYQHIRESIRLIKYGLIHYSYNTAPDKGVIECRLYQRSLNFLKITAKMFMLVEALKISQKRLP